MNVVVIVTVFNLLGDDITVVLNIEMNKLSFYWGSRL